MHLFKATGMWVEFTGRESFRQHWVFTASMSTSELIPSAPFIVKGEKCAHLEEQLI